MRSRGLFILLIGLASLAGFSYAHAEDKLSPRDEAMEMAITVADAQDDPDVDTDKTLRRRLGKEIAVVEAGASELENFVRYLPSRGSPALSGRVAIVQSAAQYSRELKVFGELPVQLGLGADYIGIKNTTEVDLPSRLTSINSGLEFTLPLFFKNTYLRLGAFPNFATDDWSLRPSAFNVSSRYMVLFNPDPKLAFVVGAGYSPGGKDGLFPIGGVIYKPNDKWMFNLVPERPTITYSFSERLDLFAEYGINSLEFKVNKAERKGVSLDYHSQRAGAGFTYKPNKFIEANLSTGATFKHFLKYGDSLGKVSIKNGIYTEFRTVISY